ncbi:LRR receptor-like serine/threonine-protein kinase RPK2 [Platanthera zijinensis]|uniref:non-specific serine/threonine protein kinase n=1 Tax=Platanthera zijinensis TaxID=2320716 RepID=A0AAP0AY22_9ASPA
MQHLLALPAFLLFFLTLSAASTAGGEREALLELKASLSDHAGLLSGWIVNSDHCSWQWISCDAGGRVVALNVSSSGVPPPPYCSPPGLFRWRWPGPARRLAGNLNPAIGMLAQLRVLFLPFHSFVGEIPDELWRLENLEVLDIEGSSLAGTLPSKLPTRLRVLNLASNLITGEIPISLSLCVRLEILDLSRNRLTGALPSFSNRFPKLIRLDLSSNRLENSIPGDFGAGCLNLEHLDLSGNSLVGSIPASLGNCSQLRSLLLFSNLLDGAVPPDLGRLEKLRALDVSRNNLRGSIPEELGNCRDLALLVLTNLFDPMPALNSSSIHHRPDRDESNSFEGGISWKITSLPALEILWAPRAGLEGDFPSRWGPCGRLEMVNFGRNSFAGEISADLDKCVNIKFLDLSSNKLIGGLSENLPIPCMDFLDISGNHISGSIAMSVFRKCPLLSPPADELLSTYSLFFKSRAIAEIDELPSFESGRNNAVYHNFGRNNFSGNLFSLPLAIDRYQNHTVYAIRADGNLVAGSLSDGVFGKCGDLGGLMINLNGNGVSGNIPSDIGVICRALLVLNASGNRIAGVIPRSIQLLDNLIALDLSSNRLTGEIPAGLKKSKALKHLNLSNNNFLAEFNELHSFQKLNLPSNHLAGDIPGRPFRLRKLTFVLLNHNSISDSQSQLYANNTQASSDKNGGGLSSVAIAAIASGAAFLSVLLSLLLLYTYSRKCAPSSSVRSSETRDVTVFEDIGIPLTYESVVRATGNFNTSNCIGSGGFGATYKAEVSPGVLVAIKRLSLGRFQGVQQFHAEIKTLGRWRHSNLVTLIGYYGSDSEMFLIYNYLPGGNLERFLQERSKRHVDWKMLHRIALDVARALAYLHNQCAPRILHRDVKPSNILLDNDFNAYLSDFGLARLLGNSETHATTGVAGTFGYVAPEYAMTCRVSDKADVYSYGVVLFELLSDKKALDPSFSPYGDGFNIVAWASMLLHQTRVHEFFTDGLWEAAPHQHLIEALKLGIRCTEERLPQRPTMKQVVRVLKELQPPGIL